MFFFISNDPLRISVSYAKSQKKVKVDNIFKILSHMVALLL